MELRTIRRALLSVSDKTGLVDFARELVTKYGVELIATGGTRKALADAGLPVQDIGELTGFPEILDGRVKTLHPAVYAGLLANRDKPEHMRTLGEHNLPEIDLVVCNLYPFEQTVARPGVTEAEVIENIDIGGPCMVRAAAKNFNAVTVIVDPVNYKVLLTFMKVNAGQVPRNIRRHLALQAFARIRQYDEAITDYFIRLADDPSFGTNPETEVEWPQEYEPNFKLKQILRYGENPHQKAAFYVDQPPNTHACVARAEPLHGKDLSYNNLLDLDSAFNLIREFAEPAAVIIKHNNPCGAAVGATLEEAFGKAYEGDPLSAFGGILAFNREVDEETATQITEPKRFVEAIIAPAYSNAAFRMLTSRPTWKKSVRLLRTGPIDRPDCPAGLDFRRVDGGLLVQTRDRGGDDFAGAKVVTKRAPTEAEQADLLFVWQVCKHVKSNAIVLAKGRAVVGVGAGQMSRVDSVEIAVRKAGGRSQGAVLASDAFFPFRDNVDAAAKAGVTAVVQPGGSMRDADSIAACDEHGLAMLFTGVRHFRH